MRVLQYAVLTYDGVYDVRWAIRWTVFGGLIYEKSSACPWIFSAAGESPHSPVQSISEEWTRRPI